MASDLDLLVVPIPAGEDPDSLLRSHGVNDLRDGLAKGRHWLHWELDRLLADLQKDPDDLSLLQRCERQGAELLAQLPHGALRRKAEQRLEQALGVIPQSVPMHVAGGGRGADAQQGQGDPSSRSAATKAPTNQPPQVEEAILEQDQEPIDELVLQAERRALRLFLCYPGLREVLSVLELNDPLHREAMGWLWCLEQRLAGGEGNRATAAANRSSSRTSSSRDDGLRAAVTAAMPAMDPPMAQLLSPLVHCGEPVRNRLAAHPEAELWWILDVLEPVG